MSATTNLSLGNASRLASGRLVIAQSLPFRLRHPLTKLQQAKAVEPKVMPPDKLALPDYLQLAMTSHVYDFLAAPASPLMVAPNLTEALGATVHLKREDLNPAFSFYVRGACAKLAELAMNPDRPGVVTSSVGSRGLAVAWAAQQIGLPATVVMPETTPLSRRGPIARTGATVITEGISSVAEASAEATRLADAHGLCMFAAHDDPLIIAGQATVGLEILQQHAALSTPRRRFPGHRRAGSKCNFRSMPRDPACVFVPVGGGSLLAGTLLAIKSVAPHVKVIGVEPDRYDVLRQSLRTGARVTIPAPGIDAVWVSRLGEEVFRLCDALVDEVITVSSEDIAEAIRDAFEDTRTLLEPHGAISIAGLKQYVREHGQASESYVAVASDACNVEFGLLQQLAHEAIRESQQEGHGNDADEASNENHLFPRKSGGSVTMSDRPYDV